MEKKQEQIHDDHRRIRQHVIAKEHTFFAVLQPGFEKTVRSELTSLGLTITDISEGGIEFTGKLRDCYKVNIASRTVSRIIMRLLTFRAERFDIFRKKIDGFPWELHIKDKAFISFTITSSGSRLYHTKRIEEECKAAIISRLGEYQKNITVLEKDKENKSQNIFIRIQKNKCTISLDSSGELLYKRTPGKHVTAATLRETLASSILMEGKIQKYDYLIDPMCGSGTFASEGANIFLNQLPGKEKDFAFKKWPAFREKTFTHLKKSLEVTPSPHSKKIADSGEPFIFASDKNQEALDIALENIKISATTAFIDIKKRDFLKEPIQLENNKKYFIVLNPPYGTRLNNGDIEKQYRQIGAIIRQDYNRCGYAIIVPSLELEKILSLPYDRKILFMNGGIKVAAIFKDNY